MKRTWFETTFRPLKPAGGVRNPLPAASSGAGKPTDDEPNAPFRGARPRLELLTSTSTDEPWPAPLDLREARIRLELVAEQLDVAIGTMDTIADLTDGGRVWKLASEGAEFLRAMRAFARGETRAALSAPRLVDRDDSA